MDEKLQKLYNIYNDLYQDQLEAAEDWYAEEFEQAFCPPDTVWKTQAQATDDFNSLLNELCEDRTAVPELCQSFGLTDDLIAAFQLIL